MYSNTTSDPKEREAGAENSLTHTNRCGCLSLDKIPLVRGVSFNGYARAALSMSNIYMNNMLIYFSCKAGGGFGEGEQANMCVNPNVTVYGMKPAALISNILIVAAVLSAILMPVFGAVVDYTRHRRKVGIIMSALLTIITAMQIGTTEQTWFAMALLQAVILMIYQVQLTALFAYYPEIARDCGLDKMTSYATTWSMMQFTVQAIFNGIIIFASYYGALGTVRTAMVSQGLTTVFCAFYLTWCWKLLPERPRAHVLPEGRYFVFAGFRQNYRTSKNIWKHYKSGLRWFLLSTIWAEASASAIASTSVIFLYFVLQLNARQIGLFFEVSLIGVIIGTKLGGVVTRRTNPCVSLQLSQVGLGLTTAIGAWAIRDVEVKELSFIWGFSIGIFLGWFYPVENIFFSLAVPKGQEAELAGFFNYCSQILGWLPPLVFTIMIQNDIPLPWALTVVASIFIISVCLLGMCGSWESIIKEANTIEIDIIGAESGVVVDEINGENGNATNGENGDKNSGENKTIDA